MSALWKKVKTHSFAIIFVALLLPYFLLREVAEIYLYACQCALFALFESWTVKTFKSDFVKFRKYANSEY